MIPPKNGWTVGQYNIFRIALGIYLIGHFGILIPWGKEMFSNHGCLSNGSLSPLFHLFPSIFIICDSPEFVFILLSSAIILSIFLTIGFMDQLAALLLWYISACLFDRNPLISNPALPYIGLLLLAQAAIPKFDKSKWHMPRSIFAVMWILMSLGYSYSGYTKLVSPSWLDGTAILKVLESPLAHTGIITNIILALPPDIIHLITYSTLAAELFFAPLALFSVTRPYIWTALMLMHIGLIGLIDFADLSIGMILLHIFTFDPNWLKPIKDIQSDIVFYDGECKLCNKSVQFILQENTQVASFRFSPLQGELFQKVQNQNKEINFPDSMIVITADGRFLFKSQAWLRIMKRLGGFWCIAAIIAGFIPEIIRNYFYDQIAKYRHHLYKPLNYCPSLAQEYVKQFDP